MLICWRTAQLASRAALEQPVNVVRYMIFFSDYEYRGVGGFTG